MPDLALHPRPFAGPATPARPHARCHRAAPSRL